MAAGRMFNATLFAEWLGLLEPDGHCNFTEAEHLFNASFRLLHELEHDHKFDCSELAVAVLKQLTNRLERDLSL